MVQLSDFGHENDPLAAAAFGFWITSQPDAGNGLNLSAATLTSTDRAAFLAYAQQQIEDYTKATTSAEYEKKIAEVQVETSRRVRRDYFERIPADVDRIVRTTMDLKVTPLEQRLKEASSMTRQIAVAVLSGAVVAIVIAATAMIAPPYSVTIQTKSSQMGER